MVKKKTNKNNNEVDKHNNGSNNTVDIIESELTLDQSK